jgi:hypothetical protein
MEGMTKADNRKLRELGNRVWEGDAARPSKSSMMNSSKGVHER